MQTHLICDIISATACLRLSATLPPPPELRPKPPEFCRRNGVLGPAPADGDIIMVAAMAGAPSPEEEDDDSAAEEVLMESPEWCEDVGAGAASGPAGSRAEDEASVGPAAPPPPEEEEEEIGGWVAALAAEEERRKEGGRLSSGTELAAGSSMSTP
jgi:hypothetical protein